LIPQDDGEAKFASTGHPPLAFSEKFLVFSLGNCSLLLYNIGINAIDIWNKITHEDMSADLSRWYNIPCCTMALILCFVNIRNLRLSLTIGLILLIVDGCIFPVLFLVDLSPNTVWWGAILAIAFSGVASSLVFSSTFSLASQFGPLASAAASSGNGCCGVLAGVLRMVTKASLSDSEFKISGSLYYIITLSVVITTLVFFLIASKWKSVASRTYAAEAADVFSPETGHTIGAIWVEWLSVAFAFVITLTLFPGYVCQIRQPSFLGDWTFLIVTTVFCVFDWVGRYLPAQFLWPPPRYVWIPVAARVLFFPIFMLSIQNVMDVGEPWWTIAWMVPFAVTNGYSATVSMIYGSNCERLSMSQRKYAGLLLSFAVNAGIIIAMGLTYAMPMKKT
jgi:equilibrative nucleoside transporter 1/2/3